MSWLSGLVAVRSPSRAASRLVSGLVISPTGKRTLASSAWPSMYST